MRNMTTLLEATELLETAAVLIEKCIKMQPQLYIQPHFHSTVVKDVTHVLQYTLPDSYAEEDELIQYLIEQAFGLYYKYISPPRSSGNTFIRRKPHVPQMAAKIKYLLSVPQPQQRTPEWYEFRYNHLTASNIWKTFISDSTRNQLIFEKCKPLEAVNSGGGGGGGFMSLESPMHWGQKYEPVSVQLYEQIYKTQISDFGCIPHRTVSFLAASPDGINTLATSKRYGRMLEVKNIVNREINGNPKMEYWIQMQVQMEVCELNECDFFETRFSEYESEEAFLADDMLDLHKGMIMLFMKEGQPLYEYAPLHPPDHDYTDWREAMMEKHADIMWLKNIYWKLEESSCVLVLRNKFWFADALPKIQELWETIEREKTTGYGHRGPKKAPSLGPGPDPTSHSKSNSHSHSKYKKYTDHYALDMPDKCFIVI